MHITKRLIAILLCALLCAPAAPAQDRKAELQANHTIAQDVLIIIQQQQVRFTAQRAVEEMRLQIFNQAGEMIYDSGAGAGPELNWPLRNASGETVRSGLYAYTLSIKEAGAGKARERRGHFIVDRADDRDTVADRIWITSQGEGGVGTELTVARSEENTVAGFAITSEPKIAEERDDARRDNERATETKNDKTKEQAKASAAAPSVTIGKIAKFTSATELGDSVMTEANGNIGIGVTDPQAGLEISRFPNLRLRDPFTNSLFEVRANGNRLEMNGGDIIIGRRLGIGGLTPDRDLTVLGALGAYINAKTGDGQEVLLGADANGGIVSTMSNHDLQLRAGGNTTKMVIKAAGNIVAVRGDGTDVLIGSAGCGAPTAAIGFGAMGGCTDYALGANVNAGANAGTFINRPTGRSIHFRENNGSDQMTIAPGGNVGIGAANPATRLHVEGSGLTEATIRSSNQMARLSLVSAINGQYAWGIENGLFGSRGLFGIYDYTAGKERLTIDTNGVVAVNSLYIRGGADLSENFDVSVATTRGEATAPKIEAGMVVSIDPANPGKLQLSKQAYDRRVAGVISGAGGVKPGMMMGQEGTLADGKHPVALSGRIYCWVDASYGAIKPGALLTTSPTPGHAMKVSNRLRSQGAIIGKAMTGLKAGKGLALILVTLQ
jgi:hypothetical protein